MNVYVMSSEGGMCKIGIAIDPSKRLKELMTGHPYKLTLAQQFEVAEGTAREVEATAHRLLSAKRMSGEWFAVEVTEAVDAVERAKLAGQPRPPVASEPPLPSGQRCWRCEFARRRWSKGDTYTQVIIGGDDEQVERSSDRLECRRNPPTIDGWPEVQQSDWCAAWEEADI